MVVSKAVSASSPSLSARMMVVALSTITPAAELSSSRSMPAHEGGKEVDGEL